MHLLFSSILFLDIISHKTLISIHSENSRLDRMIYWIVYRYMHRENLASEMLTSSMLKKALEIV